MVNLLFLLLMVLFRNGLCELPGKKKLENLFSKAESGNGLIQITEGDFERYISRGPRPYFSFIILTAIKSGNCKPCQDIVSEIQNLGSSLSAQYEGNKDVFFDENHESKPIFIMEVDFIDNRETFQKLSINTAPLLLMVPPSKTSKEIMLKNFLKYLGPKYQYSLSSGRTKKEYVEWIKKTGKDPLSWIKDSSSGGFNVENINWKLILPVIIIIPFVLFVFKSYIDKLRRSMFLYSVVALLCYGFCIGGGMFPIIRSTPWFHVDGGKVAYISHMSRYQFGVEVYIIGLANVIGGIAAFGYIGLQRNNKSNKFFGYVPIWLPIIVLFISAYVILWCYNFKNGHYNFGHLPMTGG